MIPVVDRNGSPLMPTSIARARRWILSRKATPFWNRGVWCVRLNVDPSGDHKQDIAVGIDPGSKKEGFTVKSESHTYLNIQADAVADVKEKMEARRNARRARRARNTPYRKCRWNRSSLKDRISPSTKSRWDLKLRILKWLMRVYPVTHVAVEDIKAETRNNSKKWNRSFSPLQIGKNWFYDRIRDLRLDLYLLSGYDTYTIRNRLELKKSSNKMAETFSAHCVDSWVLANEVVGGHTKPDNESMVFIRPLRWHRRQLHVFCPTKGGVRKRYGSTRSICFTRGSLVFHEKHGFCTIGGHSITTVSLHRTSDNKRTTRYAACENIKFKAYMPWTLRIKVK